MLRNRKLLCGCVAYCCSSYLRPVALSTMSSHCLLLVRCLGLRSETRIVHLKADWQMDEIQNWVATAGSSVILGAFGVLVIAPLLGWRAYNWILKWRHDERAGRSVGSFSRSTTYLRF